MKPMRLIKAGICLMLLIAGNALAQGAPDIIWQRDDHSASVRGVAFTSDDQHVISGADLGDSTFRLWAAGDGAPAGEFSLAPHAVISVAHVPGSDWVAVGYIVSGYPPGGVSAVWDLETGQERFTSGGCFVDVSADGMLLASGGGGVNRYVSICRLSDGQELHSIYTGAYIHDLAFAPDGSMVATAGGDNAVKFWDVESGTLIRSISAHDDDVSALAFSSDGAILASGAGGWDGSDDSSIKLWNVAEGTLIDTFEGHGDWVYALDFSPDGGILLSSGRDGSQGDIRFWSVASGELMRWYSASAYDLEFSSDGSTFAYGSAFSEVVLAANPLMPTSAADFLPSSLALRASPNPMRGSTRLNFNLPTASALRLSIHDVSGRKVAELFDGRREVGDHHLDWDGRDAAGRVLVPGVYFARLFDGRSVTSSKLVLLR